MLGAESVPELDGVLGVGLDARLASHLVTVVVVGRVYTLLNKASALLALRPLDMVPVQSDQRLHRVLGLEHSLAPFFRHYQLSE